MIDKIWSAAIAGCVAISIITVRDDNGISIAGVGRADSASSPVDNARARGYDD